MKNFNIFKKINKFDDEKHNDKILFLAVPLSRFSINAVYSLKLECNCACLEKKKEKYFVALNLLIEELYYSTNWKIKSRMLFRQKLGFTIKILFKRPEILWFILFNRKFEFQISPICSLHLTNLSHAWYSNTSSRLGFPWAYDGQSNGLDMIRNTSLHVLIFASRNDAYLISRTRGTLPKTSAYTTLNQQENLTKGREIIKAWQKTNLILDTDIKILHGTVLTKNTNLFLSNLDEVNINVPYGLRPSHLWSDQSQTGNKIFFTPTPALDLGELESGIHINASSNFYHFISESLRALVLAIEAEVPVEYIVIRAGLPTQFYEIIQLLAPKAELIALNRSEKISVKKLIYSEYQSCLSSNKDLFRGLTHDKIIQSDEWIMWNWLRKRWSPLRKSNQKLYLTRLKHESRGIINGVGVQNRLAKHGFKIIDTKELSFKNQKDLFSNSSSLCSTTGASLLNMIFFPQNSQILEIGYPSGDSWKFLADLLGMSYRRYEIKSRLPTRILENLDFYFARLDKIDNLINNSK